MIRPWQTKIWLSRKNGESIYTTLSNQNEHQNTEKGGDNGKERSDLFLFFLAPVADTGISFALGMAKESGSHYVENQGKSISTREDNLEEINHTKDQLMLGVFYEIDALYLGANIIKSDQLLDLKGNMKNPTGPQKIEMVRGYAVAAKYTIDKIELGASYNVGESKEWNNTDKMVLSGPNKGDAIHEVVTHKVKTLGLQTKYNFNDALNAYATYKYDMTSYEGYDKENAFALGLAYSF